MALSAVITGASAGIGAAIARRLAQSGFHLALLARRQEKLEALRKDLGAKEIEIFSVDVTSRNEIHSTIAQIEQRFGKIDVLVNNAGLALRLDRAEHAKLNEWEQCIDVNITGLAYCTHAALPGMVKRNSGHILNLGSVAGSYPYPGASIYCGTKAFVHQFSLSLRADLLGTQVRVSCIEPGLLGGTEFSTVRFRGDTEKARQTYQGTTPLQPEDIAEIVHFCIHLPPHVNINTIEVMPVGQAFAPLAIHRT